jgi:hypothetical protein
MRRLGLVIAGVGFQLFFGILVAARADSIHDCDSFQAWLRTQPASVLTLISGDTRHFPQPKSKTALVLDVKNATWYKGHIGGGGCISGWYDPVHHLAAMRDQYDTYQDLLIFYPTSIPLGIRTRDLSDIRLGNGIHLGMTRVKVEALEGKGFAMQLVDGILIKYAWSTSDHLSYDLSFRFKKDRLVAIDYGYGV